MGLFDWLFGKPAVKSRRSGHRMADASAGTQGQQLLDAILAGDVSQVQALLPAKAVNRPLHTGITPLGVSVAMWSRASRSDDRSRHQKMVDYLLKCGAAPFYDAEGVPILHEALDSGRNTEHRLVVVQYLLANGAEINALHPEYKTTALHVAVSNYHLAVVEFLLTSGADADFCDYHGRTPFFRAVDACCEAEELKLGRRRGSMPCHPDTPRKVLQVLIAKGADRPNANKDGRSPIEEARQRNCLETAALLANARD